MIRVLFDTNVLLDALLAREPFVADAAVLLDAVETGLIAGCMTATTITDIYYLVRRQTKSTETAMVALTRLLVLMEISTVDRGVLEQAITLKLDDLKMQSK